MIVRGRELLHSESDGSGSTDIMNTSSSDLEDTMKIMLFSSKYSRMYDKYCYSIFTDSLPYYVDYDAPILNVKDSLKCGVLVTFQKFNTLDKRPKEVIKEEILK